MDEQEALSRLQEGGLNQTEKSLLRAVAQVGGLTRQIERMGGKVLTGDFTMRDGSKSSIYVDWDHKDPSRPEVASVSEISRHNADQAKQIAELHAVIEYCLVHLEHATEAGTKEHSYIESHVAIRLRDVLNREVASTYVGGLKRMNERLREKAEKYQSLLAEVMSDGSDMGLSFDLADRIRDALPRQEKLDGIPGKEDNRPSQGGGAGGFSDPGK